MWQTGSVSVSDKIPLLRRNKKKTQTGCADLHPLSLTLIGRDRLTDTLEYLLLVLVLWHLNSPALTTSSTLFPASYSYPGPLRFEPPWAALYQEFANRSIQTNGGRLDILTQTINTSSSPDMVSFYSHQINQSGWTCPLKSPLVSSSVMS